MKNIAKDKNDKELNDLLSEKTKAIRDHLNDMFQGKVKNIKAKKVIKKQIAQIKTAMTMNKMSDKQNTNK